LAEPPEKEKLWREVFNVIKKTWKFPTWAVVLIVLFGTGGVFYKLYDFYKQHHPTSSEEVDGQAIVGLLQINASFFPPDRFSIPSGVFVEIENNNLRTGVPNLRVVLETNGAQFQACDVTSSAKQVGEPANFPGALFVRTFEDLRPQEKISIYCLASDIQKLTVRLNSATASGSEFGSEAQTFERSSTERTSSTFSDFLWFMLGVVVVIVTGCVVVFIVGGAVKLFKYLRLG
jgi:hypothetical protein